jgi:hypothetical protein
VDVPHCSKNRLLKPSLSILRFPMFAVVRPGYCHGYCQINQVASRAMRASAASSPSPLSPQGFCHKRDWRSKPSEEPHPPLGVSPDLYTGSISHCASCPMFLDSFTGRGQVPSPRGAYRVSAFPSCPTAHLLATGLLVAAPPQPAKYSRSFCCGPSR